MGGGAGPGGGSVGRPTSAERFARRGDIAAQLARRHGGVVRRADLLAEGLTRYDVDAQLRRGVWHRAGVHTICIDGQRPRDEGLLWRALWESGPRSVLDGPSALVVAGLRHWTEKLIHVSVPGNATIRPLRGVRHHTLRDVGPCVLAGLRRTRPEVAAVRAAQWARTDREAATVLAMVVQQRLVSPAVLLGRWSAVRASRRRRFLDVVIRDVCDGAQSINELDVAAACRARGLPVPTRQAVRTGPRGAVYLDIFWDKEKVHAEVQGAHHYQGIKVVDDSFRANDLAIGDVDTISLTIPVLGWRLYPDRYLDQVARALLAGRRRRAA
ncbi:type IV toxin-antitoxin system AbiEi family antitoxin domain-containing protein [Ornithinimicrobium pekingense]|uniref:DUF559 domain-containing protein n=1 Tax=Ornithinimicrobium pekingense TaxID=384677 RepID=A0ABQ2F2Z1_9MICO|nr:type IV toxin-antitoxin system AbiEi family antitoxin domain-containing protein [Ornithinimicrobium pekingense]GGK56893.1 hypothetical protein GCM10011509_01590 [Ornithinimicrobium pekingense]